MIAWLDLQLWWLGVRYRCFRRKLHRKIERAMLGRTAAAYRGIANAKVRGV